MGRRGLLESSAQIVGVEQPAQGQAQGTRVGGRDQEGIDIVVGDVAIAGDVRGQHRGPRGHPFEQHDAEGFLAECRRAEHRRPLEARQLLRFRDATEPLDVRSTASTK